MVIKWQQKEVNMWSGRSGDRTFQIRRFPKADKATHSSEHHSLYEAVGGHNRYIMSAISRALCEKRAEEEASK